MPIAIGRVIAGEQGKNEIIVFHVGECIIEEIETNANPSNL
jgi:hypothetical protein